jgi:glycosyltransferase involved in cell wall biosynthesis
VRPRLLIVITLAETGGAQTSVTSLLPELAQRFDVTVAASGPGPVVEAVRNAGARYVPLRLMRRDVSWRDPLALLELFVLCVRLRPHIVHAHSSKAGVLGRLAAWFARVPVRIFTAHGWAFAQYDEPVARFYLLLDRLVRPLTTRIVCVSQHTLDAGLAAHVCTAERSVVIANAVETDVPQAALDGDPPRIVAVGRLKEPKDFGLLAAALARVSVPYRAAIVGDGPDRAALEDPARATGVELLGERDDVPAQLAASDVFVLSSRSEGLPLSVLEAMAAGLPVVATAVGGVSEAATDGETALLVPPDDVDALEQALTRLLGDRELRRRLGAAGRARVLERFGLDAFLAAHLQLYRDELVARELPLP